VEAGEKTKTNGGKKVNILQFSPDRWGRSLSYKYNRAPRFLRGGGWDFVLWEKKRVRGSQPFPVQRVGMTAKAQKRRGEKNPKNALLNPTRMETTRRSNRL